MDEINEPEFKVPPTDVVKKSWLSSHMILGVVFVVVVLAAIVAGIYYWQTTRVIPESVKAPVHQDATANWKTYTNSHYGFVFKYPNDWVAENINNTFVSVYPSGDNPKETPQIYYGPANSINISIFDNSDKKNLENWFDQEYKNDEILSKQKSRLNGADVIKASIPGMISSVDLFIQLPNNYILDFNIQDNYPYQVIYNQILSTLKFTDQTACIQVITPAKNLQTGEIKDFPTPCDVPQGWEKIIQ